MPAIRPVRTLSLIVAVLLAQATPAVVAQTTRTERIAGADRIATAIAASQDRVGDQLAGVVVLARADAFADALAGAPLVLHQFPSPGSLLLTGSSELAPTVEQEIKRVLPTGRTVFVLGGTSALAPSIDLRLQTLGYQVRRMAGATRYQTAALIATEAVSAFRAKGRPDAETEVLVTTGTDFADALAAGAVAVNEFAVIVLTAGDDVPAETATFLSAHGGLPKFAVGGAAARAVPTATPLVGTDRYDTSAKVATRFFPAARSAAVASGVSFPDGLAAANVAQVGASTFGAVLLSPPDRLPAPVKAYLAGNASFGFGVIMGGVNALSEQVAQEVAAEAA